MKFSYPWIAAGLGLVLVTVLVTSGALRADGRTDLPLLTMLILSEFGFFVTAIAGGTGVRDLATRGFHTGTLMLVIANLVLTGCFLWLGLRLWPGMGV